METLQRCRMSSKVGRMECSCRRVYRLGCGHEKRIRHPEIGTGPLYKVSENDGCCAVEGRDVDKMKWCSTCKLVGGLQTFHLARSLTIIGNLQTFYCSPACPSADWKCHKTLCKDRESQAQLLPSQRIVGDYLRKIMMSGSRCGQSSLLELLVMMLPFLLKVFS